MKSCFRDSIRTQRNKKKPPPYNAECCGAVEHKELGERTPDMSQSSDRKKAAMKGCGHLITQVLKHQLMSSIHLEWYGYIKTPCLKQKD